MTAVRENLHSFSSRTVKSCSWQHLDKTLELAFRGSVMASEATDRRAGGLFSLPSHPHARFLSPDLPDAQVHRYQSNFNHFQHIACSHTSSIEHRWHLWSMSLSCLPTQLQTPWPTTITTTSHNNSERDIHISTTSSLYQHQSSILRQPLVSYLDKAHAHTHAHTTSTRTQ